MRPGELVAREGMNPKGNYHESKMEANYWRYCWCSACWPRPAVTVTVTAPRRRPHNLALTQRRAETSPPTTISVVPETTVPPETGPVYGGKVTLGMESETPGLRPWEDACASSCDNIRFSIFDQLFVVDTKFNPIPFLAIDIAPNDDFTVWVMNVREGVKFHNGVDFNAQTIADMFPIQAAGAISASLIGTSAIVGVEATGEYEVTYTLSRPNAPFPDFLATQSVGTVFDPALAVSDPDGYQQEPRRHRSVRHGQPRHRQRDVARQE